MNKKKWTRLSGYRRNIFSKIPNRVKTMIIAIMASIVIGSIFGLVSLQMATQVAGDEEPSIQHELQKESDKQEFQLKTINGLTFYVVQAGVFSNYKNADVVADQYTHASIAHVKWEKEDQIYLFTGISATEEHANRIGEKMKEQGLDVFIKEWQVSDASLNISSEDETYLHSFLSLWQTTLESDEIPKKAWLELEKQRKEVSDTVLPLQQQVKSLLTEESVLQQSFLLETIYSYEKIVH